jgi:HD superfamily phosphohydrolase
MESAIRVIRSKGHEIGEEEAEAVTIAILLHDIGHGPYSHTLEKSIIEGTSHEELSLLYMESLNKSMEGKLSLALKIFKDKHPKRFLHQLVSSQLDMDRLDYLKRDSFFSGVTEGQIGSDRIIKMLNVRNDQLVVDIKGIYSIEKFLIARRLMYWQVYFHKTSIAAENLLLMILKRARWLNFQGEKLFSTPALGFFLENRVDHDGFFTKKKEDILENFSQLDDNDILSAIKVWAHNKDKVLACLSRMLINRELFRTSVKNEDFTEAEFLKIKKMIGDNYQINDEEADYFIVKGEISNYAYNSLDDRIKILHKDERIQDITEASDMLNVAVLSKNVKKYFLCCPKDIPFDFE